MERPSLIEWTQLRSVGNSKIVQASILFPLVGYLILFNESAASLLSTSSLDRASPNEGLIEFLWIRKLYFLYFGLMFLGLGSLGYAMFCPRIIKKYGDSADYIRFDGPAMTQRMLRKLAERAGLEGLTTTTDDQILENGPDILRTWFHFQTYRHPLARDTVTTLFALGFVLISVPSIVSIIKIGSLLFRPG